MSEARNWKVLLVEDDADSAEALITLLSLYGIETQWCVDGEATMLALDVIHRLGRPRPDYALLDLNVPRTDTPQLGRDILAHPAGCPVVIVSATSSEVVERTARQIGAIAAVRKPFSMEQVLEVFERHDQARETVSLRWAIRQ